MVTQFSSYINIFNCFQSVVLSTFMNSNSENGSDNDSQNFNKKILELNRIRGKLISNVIFNI